MRLPLFEVLEKEQELGIAPFSRCSKKSRTLKLPLFERPEKEPDLELAPF